MSTLVKGINHFLFFPFFSVIIKERLPKGSQEEEVGVRGLKKEETGQQ